MKLQIVKIGFPVLRKKTEKIDTAVLPDKKFKQLIKEMIKTMHKMDGVGLAANQVGLDMQLITLECKANSRYPEAHDFPLEVWINPRILKYSAEKEEDWEGCLSIPGYRGVVPRSKWVTFEALTPEGERVEKTVSGFHARVIQHEVDHINGFFYMDRMKDLKRWFHLDEFNHLLNSHISDK